MITRRLFLALAGATGASAAAAGALRADTGADVPPGAVCRSPIQVADATEGTAANLTGERAEFDLMEKLGLLEGHLLIGRRLLEANMREAALPHFGHPAEELYTYIQPLIARRNAPAFADDLAALQRQAQIGAAAPFPALYAAVTTKVEALRATIPAELRGSGRFAIGVVAQLMLDIASDYDSAIERGRIANTVEFHDAMGFLGYCEALVAASARGATGAKAQTFRAVQREIAGAKRAFPALRPPARPVVTVAALRGHAARLADLAKDL